MLYRGSNSLGRFHFIKEEEEEGKKHTLIVNKTQNQQTGSGKRELATAEELASKIRRILRKLLKGCDPRLVGVDFKPSGSVPT